MLNTLKLLKVLKAITNIDFEIYTSIFILLTVSKPSLNVIQDYFDFSAQCFPALEYDYS